MSEKVEAKLKKALLVIAKEYGKPSGEVVEMPSFIRHRDLAAYVGTTRESVSRIMSMLKEKEIIDQRDGVIRIVKLDRLEELDL